MSTAGPNGPTTGTDDASVGTLTWTNPGNITLDDTNRATISGFLNGGQTAQYDNIRLVLAGTISGNTNINPSVVSSTDTFYGAGSSSDLWGLTLAPSDINNANFGVVFSGNNTTTSSHYIKAVGFNFSIPGGSTINGVLTEIKSNTAACFPAGYLVHTPSGNIKIENIKVGDIVYAFDKNKKLHKKKVTSLKRGYSKTFISIKTTNREISCTPNHRFLKRNKFFNASVLKINNFITIDGKQHKITSIKNIDKMSTPVYNFEVDKFHTYIINGFYVHNFKTTASLQANYIRITVTYTSSGGVVNHQLSSLGVGL